LRELGSGGAEEMGSRGDGELGKLGIRRNTEMRKCGDGDTKEKF